jgi:hypothetical protein
VSDSRDTEQQDPGPPEPEDPTPADPTPDVPTAESPTPADPTPDVPTTEVPSPAERYHDVDPAFRKGFWIVVLSLKLGLAGLTLGLLIAWFEADYGLAGPLSLGGLASLGYGSFLAWRLKRRLDAGEFAIDEPDVDGEAHASQEQKTGSDGRPGQVNDP